MTTLPRRGQRVVRRVLGLEGRRGDVVLVLGAKTLETTEDTGDALSETYCPRKAIF